MASHTNVGNTERLVSVVAGAGLVINAALKPSAGSLIAGLGGLGLAVRGLSGFCALYQVLGIGNATPVPEGFTVGRGKRGASRPIAGDDPSAHSFPASDPPATSGTAIGRPATA